MDSTATEPGLARIHSNASVLSTQPTDSFQSGIFDKLQADIQETQEDWAMEDVEEAAASSQAQEQDQPTSRHILSSPVDYQLRKVICVMMESQKMSCSEDYLNQLTDLSIAYFNELAQELRKITELQRRRLPSLSDTKVFLRTRGLEPYQLIPEVIQSKKLSVKCRDELRQIEGATLKIIVKMNAYNDQFDPDDKSLPFYTNERYEIAELVPRQTKRPSYIQTYLPDLPPDYTYQNTAKFMDRLTDLKELRLKLVEESRLTEKSLYDLIEDDGRKWRKDFESELALDEEQKETDKIIEIKDTVGGIADVSGTSGERAGVDKQAPAEVGLVTGSTTVPGTETTKPKESKSFDIVEYAQKRRHLLDMKLARREKKLKQREANIFITAEKYYSPYPQLQATPEITLHFKKIMQDEFKSVIRSVRTSEQQKQKKIEELLRERSRKERSLHDGIEKYEFGFNFNQIKQSDDETDEEVEKPNNEDFPVFDFGQEDELVVAPVVANAVIQNNSAQVAQSYSSDADRDGSLADKSQLYSSDVDEEFGFVEVSKEDVQVAVPHSDDMEDVQVEVPIENKGDFELAIGSDILHGASEEAQAPQDAEGQRDTPLDVPVLERSTNNSTTQDVDYPLINSVPSAPAEHTSIPELGSDNDSDLDDFEDV